MNHRPAESKCWLLLPIWLLAGTGCQIIAGLSDRSQKSGLGDGGSEVIAGGLPASDGGGNDALNGGGAGAAGTIGAAGTESTTASTTSVAGAGTSGTTGIAGTGVDGSNGGSGASSQGGIAGKAGQAGAGGGLSGGAAGAGGGPASSCVGAAWPTADPTVAGPFAVAADKNVGPAAGVVPDPIYGDTQQHFNVYRPEDLAQGGYCHPILVWANGNKDNPEPNPPSCDGSQCGSYLELMNQLASHGFVVIASLSTITSQGNPLPTIVGLDWLITQADDATSPYYHRLDTAHIGALGHSEGGFSTSKAASDLRISAIATVSGSAVNANIHGPSLWFCGGKDTTVPCSSVMKTYDTITTQPAMFVNNLDADYRSWLSQDGAKGPDIFGLTAWFRLHLMGDTANRKMFYGPNCTLCTESRVQARQNSFLAQ